MNQSLDPLPPPQLKIPGAAPVYVTWFLLLLLLIIIINLLYLRKFITVQNVSSQSQLKIYQCIK